MIEIYKLRTIRYPDLKNWPAVQVNFLNEKENAEFIWQQVTAQIMGWA
jgi:hypothetical protein